MNHNRRRRRRIALIVVLLGVAATILVYCVPPSQSSIYPPCIFYATTGWHCPGCGATRCLHALLHGRVAEAASYNVLFLLLLPVLAILCARALWSALVGKRARPLSVPTWLVIALAILLIAYGIMRNIEQPPFCRLAPGALWSARGATGHAGPA